MIKNEQSIAACADALRSAGMPVKFVGDGKVRYHRALSREELDTATPIVDAWLAGRFDYLDNRVYPSIGEQLDILWHDMENNTTAWRDTIRTIKDANPKLMG